MKLVLTCAFAIFAVAISAQTPDMVDGRPQVDPTVQAERLTRRYQRMSVEQLVQRQEKLEKMLERLSASEKPEMQERVERFQSELEIINAVLEEKGNE